MKTRELMQSFLVAAFAAATFFSCAAPEKIAVEAAVLPEVDVLQMKENSDAALKLAHRMKMELDATRSRLTELETMLVELEKRVASLPLARLDEVESEISLLGEEIDWIRVQMNKKGMAGTFHPTRTRRLSDTLPPPPPAYRDGIRQYRNKAYGEALKSFGKVVLEFPDGLYADDARFWAGECLYSLGDFAKAIASFQKVFSFVATDKGAQAQYRIGHCYKRLGDRKQAIAEFRKVGVLYPDSPEKSKAELELNKLETP